MRRSPSADRGRGDHGRGRPAAPDRPGRRRLVRRRPARPPQLQRRPGLRARRRRPHAARRGPAPDEPARRQPGRLPRLRPRTARVDRRPGPVVRRAGWPGWASSTATTCSATCTPSGPSAPPQRFHAGHAKSDAPDDWPPNTRRLRGAAGARRDRRLRAPGVHGLPRRLVDGPVLRRAALGRGPRTDRRRRAGRGRLDRPHLAVRRRGRGVPLPPAAVLRAAAGGHRRHRRVPVLLAGSRHRVQSARLGPGLRRTSAASRCPCRRSRRRSAPAARW